MNALIVASFLLGMSFAYLSLALIIYSSSYVRCFIWGALSVWLLGLGDYKTIDSLDEAWHKFLDNELEKRDKL